MKLVSRFGGLLNAVAVAFLLFTGQLLSWAPSAWVPQLLAVALAFWARASFPKGQFSVHPEPREPKLIEAGPYRWIRHPMYTSVQTILWTGVLHHLTPYTLAAGAITLFVVVVRIRDEEALLRENIPGYPEYMTRTKRFVPFVF
jgi:protein-S-isoprenylcysteine O-methyltransferase Ste14